MQTFDSDRITDSEHETEGQTAMFQGSIGVLERLLECAEIEACRDLWLAVLGQAIKDARGIRTYHGIVKEAREWFESENEGPGSFLWICRVLCLDPEAVKSTVEKEYYYEAA